MRLSSSSRVLGSKFLAVIFVLTASICVWVWADASEQPAKPQIDKPRAIGVCPPFPLRDEAGNIINPVSGTNADVPYSPKQTCGTNECHDYEKITQGFHFTQGKGETMPSEFAARYNWVSSPGNYGGNWCSPSPLYRQLAPKSNSNPRAIDMTSFDFVTATCGNCHPGGGPMEYDRDGRRYDQRMADAASGFTSGGDNGLDGDYYKARWAETGVIEADCMLCHMPEYDYKKRNAQLANLNFRWAATEGAGFGSIAGKVSAGDKPKVEYRKDIFDENGNVTVHIAPSPRNETCLNCHAKPDWKKRGASFSAHTDVHMAKGLDCVDCHTSGSQASDPKIRGKEVHQVGKGDDPSGWVRNDLDNTVRTCESCHADGTLGAPIAKHSWLPPLHLDKIACATCHISRRYTKSALVQASDVFNSAPRITPPPKHIWTFYDQQMNFWNHYGELELFTVKDQPVNEFRPSLIRYKDKIFPANRVHSTWVGYEEEGKPGLNQLYMKDFYSMWLQHRNDPSKYAPLALIKDDNGDGTLEVNRPEEINALLQATSAFLKNTSFPMQGKRLVYVSDSRKYYSGNDSREIPRQDYEATAYASVYKYSHNVLPARSALGIGGCTDCHSKKAQFFTAATLDHPFSGGGKPTWMPNYRILGLSSTVIGLSAFREQWLKPTLYLLLTILLILAAIFAVRQYVLKHKIGDATRAYRWSWWAAVLGIAGLFFVAFTPRLLAYMTVERFNLDANHFWIALAVLVLSLWAATAGRAGKNQGSLPDKLTAIQYVLTVIVVICGILMLIRGSWIEWLSRFAYTAFDLGLTLMTAVSVVLVLMLLAAGRYNATEKGSPKAL
jgi:hypothetical protein